MRRFVDTNFLVRFKEGNVGAVQMMKRIKDGKDEYFLPAIVIEEVVWLLAKFYKEPKKEIINFIKALLVCGNLKVVYVYDVERAMMVYGQLNVKFTDCVIYGYMKKGDLIVSYDRDFDRLPGIKRVDPGVGLS